MIKEKELAIGLMAGLFLLFLVDISINEIVKIYFACRADRDTLKMLPEGVDLSDVEKDSALRLKKGGKDNMTIWEWLGVIAALVTPIIIVLGFIFYIAARVD